MMSSLIKPLEWVVVVRFKAVGNAPIMKQNFYKITAANRFQAVIQFLRKELGWKAGDPLVRALLSITYRKWRLAVSGWLQFTYINLAFSPAPDDTVSNLYKVCSSWLLSRCYLLVSHLYSLLRRMDTWSWTIGAPFFVLPVALSEPRAAQQRHGGESLDKAPHLLIDFKWTLSLLCRLSV